MPDGLHVCMELAMKNEDHAELQRIGFVLASEAASGATLQLQHAILAVYAGAEKFISLQQFGKGLRDLADMVDPPTKVGG